MGSRFPERDDPLLERRVALALFFVGSVVCGVGGLLKPDLTDGARTVQLAASGGLALLGVLVLATPGRRTPIHGAALTSVALLGLMLATSNALGPTAFFLLWPLVHLAYFSTRARTAAGLVLMVAVTGVASAVNPFEVNRADLFVGTVVSVGLMVVLVRLMSERELILRRALADAANTDALTGLLNRRGIEPELERLLAGGRLSIVMVDLDHFKRYNDRHGHLVGDEALRRVAGVLTAAAGPDDRVARFGGEEFTVALTGSDGHGARAYAGRVMDALRAEDVAEDLRLTVSVGVATLGADGASVDALLRRADAALYHAKATGRDRVASATPLPHAA
ncbi:GGDEF domain-containing protein [Baekduia sp.]|uniref:GGDEF domain-containing protein n=1 Tax=Baekduia sp. TaxID=2600305 RepID=UPI002D77FF8D|nr:GGDEF domain-containing protein [Baekduia sp.]